MDRRVEIIIYRDDGERFAIDGTDWRIPSDGLENWHTMETDVTSIDIAMRDVTKVIHERVGSIDRTITAEVRDTSKNERLREQASRFFLPKRGYEVIVRYMGRTSQCRGVQIMVKLSEGNVYRPVQLKWTILCESPYMMGNGYVYSTDDAPSVGKFAFPYVSTKDDGGYHNVYDRGFVISQGGFGKLGDSSLSTANVQFIVNDGDVPVYPEFEVANTELAVARGLTIERLQFTNDGWAHTMSEITVRIGLQYYSDNVYIDTSAQPLKVTMEGGDEIEAQYVDASSYFLRTPTVGTGLSAYAAWLLTLDDTGKLVKSYAPGHFRAKINEGYVGI